MAQLEHCDIAILTVIEVELAQMLKAFGQAERIPKAPVVYYRVNIFSNNTGRALRIVIGNVAKAGLVSAALRTARLLQHYRPSMVILAGIAAG